MTAGDYKERVLRYYEDKTRTMLPGKGGLDFPHKLDILTRLIQPDFRVLDAGCGNGSFALRIAPQVRSVTGCDFTRGMVEYFRERAAESNLSNTGLVNGDLSALPFGNGVFDLVYSFSTLYYIRELSTVFSDFNRVLKPGGLAILELVNILNPGAWHSLARYDCPQFFLTPAAIRNVVRKAGFTILGRRYFHLVPTIFQRGPLKRILDRVGKNGKTVNERISSLPVVRYFSMKQIIICRQGPPL